MVAAQRNVMHLMMVIALVTLPTAVALTYYIWSNDPTTRPLGITQQSLDAFERNGRPAFEIVAHISYDPRYSQGMDRAELARSFTNVFRSKGVHMRVAFTDTGGAGTWVTYQIGPSTIGPYALSDASEGVSAAVEAYRMTVPTPAE